MGSERQLRSASGDVLGASDNGEPAAPIDEKQRDVTTILNEWREAERRASSAVAGSADERVARADVDRLRAEYQRAHGAAATTPNG